MQWPRQVQQSETSDAGPGSAQFGEEPDSPRRRELLAHIAANFAAVAFHAFVSAPHSLPAPRHATDFSAIAAKANSLSARGFFLAPYGTIPLPLTRRGGFRTELAMKKFERCRETSRRLPTRARPA